MGRNHDSKSENIRTIAGYLASAMDMEDEISNSVYRDYLDAKNWPGKLKGKEFEAIKAHLNTLIKDTERHKKIFSDLNNKLDNDDK